MKPGRSSISSTSKTPPIGCPHVRAKLIRHEELRVCAAFSGSDFDNHSVHSERRVAQERLLCATSKQLFRFLLGSSLSPTELDHHSSSGQHQHQPPAGCADL
jgi:hypothetical protein